MDTPRFGHDPIEMRRVAGYDEMRAPGDFYWSGEPGTVDHELVAALPTKHYCCDEHFPNDQGYLRCRQHGMAVTYLSPWGWSIGRVNSSGAQWEWNGDLDKPTLNPSLHAVGVWHGWVRDGMMIEA